MCITILCLIKDYLEIKTLTFCRRRSWRRGGRSSCPTSAFVLIKNRGAGTGTRSERWNSWARAEHIITEDDEGRLDVTTQSRMNAAKDRIKVGSIEGTRQRPTGLNIVEDTSSTVRGTSRRYDLEERTGVIPNDLDLRPRVGILVAFRHQPEQANSDPGVGCYPILDGDRLERNRTAINTLGEEGAESLPDQPGVVDGGQLHVVDGLGVLLTGSNVLNDDDWEILTNDGANDLLNAGNSLKLPILSG